LNRVANHRLSAFFIQPQSGWIGLGVSKLSVTLLHDDRITFRRMIEERLDERLRSLQLPGAIFDSPLQGLVELGQGLFGLLGDSDVVRDADEADMLARRSPPGLRFRSQPTPLAIVTSITGLENERLPGSLSRPLVTQDSLEIVWMKSLTPIEIQGIHKGNAQKLVIRAIDELSKAVEPAHPHRHRGAVRDRPKPLFALGQNLFTEFARRYVDNNGVQAQDPSRLIAMRNMHDLGLDRSVRSRKIGLVG
jgi:hypothetical protein